MTAVIVVPHEQLLPQTLSALIEEFVTRHGAVQGHAEMTIEQMSAQVLRQLKAGEATIIFDESSESCSIVLKNTIRNESQNIEE